ncbi:ADGRB1 [Branchiostoma lanceolatum]|uniref:ADGRB1 protein n=1 Tax=Branchiostoma lanceolatum TaxID=7740 RepID=A0A8J9YKD9_BRALA|nr:ADGRB1 [Branchiostoma lanceolatum]
MLCRTVEIVLLLGLTLWPVYVYVCPVVHCQWGEWSHWSSCTASCGPSGTQDRTRVIDVAPQCGGAACSGSSRGSRDCNRFCHNGGFLSTHGCSCSSGYTGNCCQSPETDLATELGNNRLHMRMQPTAEGIRVARTLQTETVPNVPAPTKCTRIQAPPVAAITVVEPIAVLALPSGMI